MSNRNFDSRVIIQRLQNQVYSRNTYINNTSGKQVINNPQNSNGNASVFNSFKDGAQTQYFRGLIGGGETISPGGIAEIGINNSVIPAITETPEIPEIPDPPLPTINEVRTNIVLEYVLGGASSGTWFDRSGVSGPPLNATMTALSGISYANGYFTFDGTTNQYGRIAHSSGRNDFTNNDNYTVELWFNPSNSQVSDTLATVLEKWDSNNESRYPYAFRYAKQNTTLSIAVYDGTNNNTINIDGINTNTWYQIVVVFDFTTNKLMTAYKNGVHATVSGNANLESVGNISNTSSVCIAHRTNTAGDRLHRFTGSIGLIRIYNAALTASDVLQNFNTNKFQFGIN